MKKLPHFIVECIYDDGRVSVMDSWGVIRKSDSEMIIREQLAKGAKKVKVITGNKVWQSN